MSFWNTYRTRWHMYHITIVIKFIVFIFIISYLRFNRKRMNFSLTQTYPKLQMYQWGHSVQCFGLFLRFLRFETLDLSREWLNEDLTGQPAGPAGADGGPPDQLSEGQARFPSLSCDDLNALVAQQRSANIKEQTRWVVKVFIGEWWWISITKWFVD